MDLLSVENFLKLTLYLKERLVLFYWIICFPRSALVYVLKSMLYCGSQSKQIIHTTEQNHQSGEQNIKLIQSSCQRIPYVLPGLLSVALKVLTFSKTCPLMVRSPKFICLSKTGWREMDCDWHFKSKLGSAKQMIRIKQM